VHSVSSPAHENGKRAPWGGSLEALPDLKFLKEAIDLAAEHSSDGRCGPFGAVVARCSEVVGRGFNMVVESQDPTAHAEIAAIREACERLDTHDLSGCTLYTSCEPCPMCLGAIYWAGIDRVVYAASRSDAARAGFDDEFLYAEVSLAPTERSMPFMQALPAQGRAVLQAWSGNPKRRMY